MVRVVIAHACLHVVAAAIDPIGGSRKRIVESGVATAVTLVKGAHDSVGRAIVAVWCKW